MEIESPPTATPGSPLFPHACDPELVHSVSNRVRHLADKINEHIDCYDKEYAALQQRLDACADDNDKLAKAFRQLLKTLPHKHKEASEVQKQIDDVEATVQRLSASFSNARTRDCAVVKALALDVAASKAEIATAKDQIHTFYSDLRHSISVVTSVQQTHDQLISTVIGGQTDFQVQLAALAAALPGISQDLTALWNSTQTVQPRNESDPLNHCTLAAEFEDVGFCSNRSATRPLPLCASPTFTNTSGYDGPGVAPLILDSATATCGSAGDHSSASLPNEGDDAGPQQKSPNSPTVESSAASPLPKPTSLPVLGPLSPPAPYLPLHLFAKLRKFLSDPQPKIPAYTPYATQALAAGIILGTFFACVFRGALFKQSAAPTQPPAFASETEPFKAKLYNYRAPPAGW